MSSYSFSDEAVKDINSICEYIARQNPDAASKLFDAIRRKCKLVASFPNMGKSYSKIAPRLRGFIVEDYIIFFYPNLSLSLHLYNIKYSVELEIKREVGDKEAYSLSKNKDSKSR